MVPSEIVRVTAQIDVPNGIAIQNVYEYICTTSQSDAAAHAMLTNWFINGMWANLKVKMPNVAVLNFVKTQVLLGNGHVGRDLGVTTVGVAGSSGDAIADPQTAAVVMAKTASPRRRGLKFTAPVSEVMSGAGLIADTLLSWLALYLVEWLKPVVVSGVTYFLSGVLKTNGSGFQPFVGTGQVNNRTGRRGSRRVGRGL